jgi:hypothetical protein
MELALSYPPGDDQPTGRPVPRPAPAKGREPGWANGLRQLYNSVLHEPLPGSFDDLLKKLDKDDDE